MAYDENRAINLGRLATYDALMKDHIEDRLQGVVLSEDVDVDGETGIDEGIVLSEIDDTIISDETTWSSEKINASLANAGGGSNINILDNWDFRNPVNRKGYTNYGNGDMTIIDRWSKEWPGTVSITSNGLMLTVDGTESDAYVAIHQTLSNFDELVGQTVTLSVDVDGVIETATFQLGQLTNGAGAGVLAIFSVSNGNIVIRLYKNDATTCTIRRVKLELGDKSTMELDAPANYAEEYAICSQYSPSTGEFVGSQNSNANLLDNWYFKNPVNRQGFTSGELSNPSVGTYFIDRWFGVNLHASVSEEGLSIAWNGTASDGGASLNGYIGQAIRYGSYDSQYTISALIDGELYSTTLDAPNGKQFVNGPRIGDIQFNARYREDVGYINIHIFTYSTTPKIITAVKYELGSIQTLARKNDSGEWVLIDPPCNYESEYIKCVQYNQTTGEYIGLNANAIKALSVEDGGTVNAPIEVIDEVKVTNPTAATTAAVKTSDAGVAELQVSDNSNNLLSLQLNKDANIKDLAKLNHTSNNNTTSYNLYGEHNKPTAEDIGAQTKITGTKGQFVGFDNNGNATPTEAPKGANVYTGVIGTNWTEDPDTGVKSQTVSIQGITADNTAKVSNYYTGDKSSDSYATFVAQDNEFLDFITNGYAETVNGGITFYIFGDSNTIEIPIFAEVV